MAETRIDLEKLRAEFEKKLNRKKKHKYGAKRQKVAGVWFDSGLEAAVDGIIRMQEMAGELKLLQRQEVIPFIINGITVTRYKADFKVQDVKTGEIYRIEPKGHETNDWLIKKNLWKAIGPSKLVIYGGSAKCPIITETIIPKFISPDLQSYLK